MKEKENYRTQNKASTINMNEIETIGEGEVLLATVRHLLKRKAIPFQISVASGKGIDTEQIEMEVKRIFGSVSFKPDFVGRGPYIIAVSENEWWIVECKGAGIGKTQTQRNNFDRALASVVSYYEDRPSNPPDWAKNASIFLGLALPASQEYLRELKRRVRAPLRQRLNLWILLYDGSDKHITVIAPTEPYK